jgi:DNA-binding response OmpR family regulator
MVSTRGGEDNILRGFHVGADDYISKPFISPRQLVMRIAEILRGRIDSDGGRSCRRRRAGVAGRRCRCRAVAE